MIGPPRRRQRCHRLGLDRVDGQVGRLVEAAKAGGGADADFDAAGAAHHDSVARSADTAALIDDLGHGGEHHAAPGRVVVADGIRHVVIIGRGVGRCLAVQDQPVALDPHRSAKQCRQRQIGIDRPAIRRQPHDDQLRWMRHEYLAAIAGLSGDVGHADDRLVQIEFAAVIAHRTTTGQRDHQVADRRLAVGKGPLQLLRLASAA